MAGIASAVKPIGTVETSSSPRFAALPYQGDERCPDRSGCEPCDEDRPLAEAGNESPGEKRHHCRRGCHRKQREAPSPAHPTHAAAPDRRPGRRCFRRDRS